MLIALRTLEEQAVLFRRMAQCSAEQGSHALVQRFEDRAMQCEVEAEAISTMLRGDRREVSEPGKASAGMESG